MWASLYLKPNYLPLYNETCIHTTKQQIIPHIEMETRWLKSADGGVYVYDETPEL